MADGAQFLCQFSDLARESAVFCQSRVGTRVVASGLHVNFFTSRGHGLASSRVHPHEGSAGQPWSKSPRLATNARVPRPLLLACRAERCRGAATLCTSHPINALGLDHQIAEKAVLPAQHRASRSCPGRLIRAYPSRSAAMFRFRSSTQRRTVHQQPTRIRLAVERLEGRDLPSFVSSLPFAAGYQPAAVVTGDFNGDGKLDLAVANNGAYLVSVLRRQHLPTARELCRR